MQRLSELFNVNHFIVCQVNPHVVPVLRFQRSRASVFLSWILSEVCALVYAWCRLLFFFFCFEPKMLMPISSQYDDTCRPVSD